MNQRFFIFYDFETGSINPYTTQPLQLAAFAIHPRSLKIESGHFNSYIKPFFTEEECKKNNVDEIQEKALKVNKINLLDLHTAPTMSVVVNNLTEWIKPYSKGDRPIRIGYNNRLFDDIILDRYCPLSKRNENKLFYKRSFDLMDLIWLWTENTEMEGMSFDAIRDWLGISKVGAHEARKDVEDGALVFIRFLQYMRKHDSKNKFANAFGK